MDMPEGENKMMMNKQAKVSDIKKANEIIDNARHIYQEVKWARAFGVSVRIEPVYQSQGYKTCGKGTYVANELVKMYIKLQIEQVDCYIKQLQEMGIDTTELEGELR